MAKLTLNDINNISGNPTSAEQLLNANFTAIEVALENTLSRDGTTPNQLEAALDANSQRILNLPYALSNTEPVTLAQVLALVSGGDWTGGIGIPSVVFYQDAEPTATAAGQVWVKKADLTIWIWDGTSWIRQEDPNLQYAVETADAAALAASTASSTALAANTLASTANNTANQAAVDLDALEPRVLAVEQDSAAVNLAIIELESDVGTLAAQITTVSADVGTNSAAIVNEQIARINGDNALAATINSIQASNGQIFIQATAPVPGVGGAPNPIPAGSWWYDSDDGNKQYRYVNSSWQNVTPSEVTALQASITAEQTARIGADNALASDITQLQTWRGTDYALILSNNQARIDGDAALATSVSGLEADLGNLSSTVATSDAARVAGDSALASSISTIDARVTGNTSSISSLSATVNTYNQARIDGDTALSNQLSTVNTTVGGLSTTVSQHTTSINGIEGKYTVKIDSNGYITGFGLVATGNTAAPTSTFTVLANNFRIVTPGGAPVTPFYVEGGVTYIKNVVIDTAAIGTATIGTSNIKPSAVSDIATAEFNFQGTAVSGNLANVYKDLSTAYGVASVAAAGISSGSKVFIRGYFNARGAGGNVHWCFFRIRRNDGVILSGVPQLRMLPDYSTISWEWIDPNPVGPTHTYTVQVMRSSNDAIGNWQEITLFATHLKR